MKAANRHQKKSFEFIRARIPALAVKTWDEDSNIGIDVFNGSYEKLNALLERNNVVCCKQSKIILIQEV